MPFLSIVLCLDIPDILSSDVMAFAVSAAIASAAAVINLNWLFIKSP